MMIIYFRKQVYFFSAIRQLVPSNAGLVIAAALKIADQRAFTRIATMPRETGSIMHVVVPNRQNTFTSIQLLLKAKSLIIQQK